MISFRGTCPVIGYLTPTLSDSVSTALWLSVVEAVQTHRAHSITFVGGWLGDAESFRGAANTIYRLIRPSQLDGLVSRASALGGEAEFEEVVRFHRCFCNIPLVGLTLPMPGVPTIEVNSYRGMQALVSHLVDTHGYRRVAFIRGPAHHASAAERYAAYEDLLQARCLDLDPVLVTSPGTFDETTGAAGIVTLIDRRGLRPGEDFDAVVAVSDLVALGALQELERRGFCVPDDVALVGFDDADEQWSGFTPLTTVAMPFDEQGSRAVEMLLALLEDRTIPRFPALVPKVVIRHSCGCQLPAVSEAAIGMPLLPSDSVHTPLRSAQPDPAALLDAIGATVRPVAPHSARHAQELVTGFLQDLAGPHTGVFLAALERALRDTIRAGEEVGVWQDAISALRHATVPLLAAAPEVLLRAEDLLCQARVALGEAAARAQAYRAREIQRHTAALRDVGRGLTSAASLPELTEALADSLPALGIRSCYLCLYDDVDAPSLETVRLYLAFGPEGQKPMLPKGERLPVGQLLPKGALCGARPQQLVAEPLVSRGKPLGFVLFGLGPREGHLYDLLAEEIGSALESTLLLARNVDLYEKSLVAQQAAEEANRLKSRFLSTVSHELRLPLSLLVGLSEMLLHEQAHGDLDLPELYEQDLARIHVSARQLDALVGDVLDLTQSHMGQLKLVKVPLALQDVVDAAGLVGEQMAQEKGLTWRTRLPRQLPWVLGDRMRLQQVLLNLISNAVKFTPSGEIVLEIQERDDVAVVMIHDTGLGVPLNEQDVIFDEFRQSERTAARGYGGLGLGLALCRTLVEMHDGEIGVRSSGLEKAGSTFYFTLPTIGPVVASANTALQTDTALVLTHQQGGAAALVESLRDRGIPVAVAVIDDDDDWLPLVVAAPPAVIILDVQPASHRGWELMQALKHHPRTARIPVLFCKMLADRNRVGLISIDRLTKPLNGEALLTALQRHGFGKTGAEPRQTLLVVDDDPDVLAAQVRMIHAQLPGCRVMTATDGRQALSQMQCVKPDLVLLDLRMPELDGFGFLDAMWEHPATRRIPVIVLTGQVLMEQDVARLQRGVTTVLSKGVFNTEEVVEHIQSTLTSSRQLNCETQQLVRRAMAYMHEHYPEPISRKEIADHVNLSESYLSICFRQELKVTPISYLNRYRIWQSKRLLVTSDRSISDIALDVGFSSASYFGRVFHREVGLPPTAYRRGERNRSD